MPLRRGSGCYDREREGEEAQSLLGDSIHLGRIPSYKKDEDLSPSSRHPPDPTIQCDIQPKDTLLSLSLKYNVPLAELKRVNNILSDQGFYALKRIKIPVRPHSLLIPDVHDRCKNNNGWVLETKESPVGFSSDLSSRVSTGYSSPYSELGDEGETNGGEMEQHHQYFNESKDKKKVKKILKDMDKDLDRIREKQSELETVTGDPAMYIKEPIKFPLRASQIPTDDPGCSNRVLGCWCVVVAILIVAVFFVLVQLMAFERDTTHDGWNKTETSQEQQKPNVMM